MSYSELTPFINKLIRRIDELDVRDITKKYLIDRLVSQSSTYNLYAAYPYFYSKPFSYNNDEVLLELSLASYLYYLSIIIIDKVTDKQINDPNLILVSHDCKINSIMLLFEIFPKNSEFWLYFKKRNNEWLEAYNIERLLKSKKRIEEIEVFNFFILKSAIGKLAIDALYVLTNKKDVYRDLLALYNNFYIARQIQDDIADFDEDLINEQFNIAVYYTNKVISDNPELKSYSLKKNFYLFVFEDLIKNKGLTYLSKCHEYISKTEFNIFLKRIMTIDIIFNRQMEILKNYKEELMYKKEIRKVVGEPFDNQLLNKPLNYILQMWETGYHELRHRMLVPKDNDLAYQSVSGDVFQRAIITTHLMHIRDFLKKQQLDNFIEYEHKYLLSNKFDETGWKYFPNYDELPTDVDDLAQMIQVFKGLEKSYFNDIFQEPITKLLNSTNKIFNTWVFSEQNYKVEKNNVINRWGDTLDIGVIANISYSLNLIVNKIDFIDKIFLKEIIEKNIEYLMLKQKENGFWDSNWYANPFYVMYISNKSIATNNNNHSFIEKSKKKLIDFHYNMDGSFGNNKYKALDISLSILILLNNGLRDEHIQIVQKSAKKLISLMNDDGSFVSSNFIKMDIGRAKNKIDKTLYYRSNTLCTSYCLLSLFEADRNGIKI